jgi:hypothetical protein
VNTRVRPVRVTVPDIDLAGARELLHGGTHGGGAVALDGHGAAVLELRPGT